MSTPFGLELRKCFCYWNLDVHIISIFSCSIHVKVCSLYEIQCLILHPYLTQLTAELLRLFNKLFEHFLSCLKKGFDMVLLGIHFLFLTGFCSIMNSLACHFRTIAPGVSLHLFLNSFLTHFSVHQKNTIWRNIMIYE